MNTKQLNQITDVPLIADEERRVAFRQELTQLLNRYGIDNACNVPDYLLACHVDSHLMTVRDLVGVRDRLHPPKFEKGARGPFPEHHPVSDYLAGEETLELAKKIREQLLEKGKPCYVCHGTGYLVPQAVGAPTLERWLNSMRELNEKLGAENTQGFKDLQASAEDLQQELTQLEIDPTKLSDAEKARILHNYDWSDNAPDNALQRAGRQLMVEAEKRGEIHRPGGVEGGASCSQ